jgi:N-acyl homoserine lactone hydrolase
MKLYFQHHGNLECDIRWLLNGSEFATRQNQTPQTRWYKSPSLTLVIEHPDGNILFDTSCPRDWRDRWAGTPIPNDFVYDNTTDEQFLDASLNRLGYELSDFGTIVASHLHYDHAGNLGLFANTGARIIAHEAEVAGAMGFAGDFHGAHIKRDYQDVDIETVSGDVEIAPGVTLLELPGHTWGTMGVLVDLPDTGPVIFTSDAVYMRASYGPPALGSPIVWSSLDWLKSVEKIRRLAEKHNAMVVFGHDEEMVHSGELQLAPDYYQ